MLFFLKIHQNLFANTHTLFSPKPKRIILARCFKNHFLRISIRCSKYCLVHLPSFRHINISIYALRARFYCDFWWATFHNGALTGRCMYIIDINPYVWHRKPYWILINTKVFSKIKIFRNLTTDFISRNE